MQRVYVLTVNDGMNEAILPSQEDDFFVGQRHLSCRLALLPRRGTSWDCFSLVPEMDIHNH